MLPGNPHHIYLLMIFYYMQNILPDVNQQISSILYIFCRNKLVNYEYHDLLTIICTTSMPALLTAPTFVSNNI